MNLATWAHVGACIEEVQHIAKKDCIPWEGPHAGVGEEMKMEEQQFARGWLLGRKSVLDLSPEHPLTWGEDGLQAAALCSLQAVL